jgi:hypothetical protein
VAILLFVVSSTLTSADPGTAAVNLVPAAGKHRGIVLKSQTVDAVLSEEKGKIRADTRVWLRLQNPASKPITVSVELPGPQLAPAPLPSPLDVRVDDVPIALRPAAAKNGVQPSGATTAIRVPARGAVEVKLSFSEELPDDEGVVTFAYPLIGADQWAGTPESLRVTVEMMSPSVSRALLLTSPPAHRASAQMLTWDWETEWVKSRPSVGLAFISPSWQGEFEAARAAAAAADAGVTEHIALSQHYRRLASLPVPTFADPTLFRTRYYPAAIAELQVAIATSGPAAETRQARSLLAELYLQEADRSESKARRHYLQAAAAEVQLASQPPSKEPLLAKLANEIFSQLAQEAEASGDSRLAGSYRKRLEVLSANQDAQAGNEATAASVLSRAVDAVNQGDINAARGLLAIAYGLEASVLPGDSPPIVSRSALTVTTTSSGRTIVMLLGHGENLSEATELARQAEAALRSQSSNGAVARRNTLTITLPIAPGSALLEYQQALATRMPDAPELALLRAVLEDARGAADTQSDLVRSTWRYSERVDLSRALQGWLELAAQLDAALPDPLPGGSAAESEQLQWVRRHIRASNAAAWRDFAANSRVDYRFEDSDADSIREWQLRPGETRELLVERQTWNLENAQWAILALAAVLIGAATLVWRRA